MRKPYLFYILTMLLLSAVSCKTTKKETPAFDVSQMDTTVPPGYDFYAYANGNWLKSNKIPDDKSSYGSFDILQEENNNALKTILERAANKKNAPEGSSWQKVGDFYKSGMDTSAIEIKGLDPIRGFLDQIDAISNTADLQNQLAELHAMRVSPLFNISVRQDRKNSTEMMVYLSQGGLGLPDRDYYLSDDSRSEEIRNEYYDHLKSNFNLLGYPEEEAKRSASAVMDIETQLAEVSYTRLERRDPTRTYNKITSQEIQYISPKVNWNDYFKNIGIDTPAEFVIDNPDFFKEISQLLNNITINNWKDYLTWNVVNGFSPYLSSAFVNQQFSFYGTILSGNEKNRPRWQRVSGSANMAIGELVGQVFVEENFSPEAKTKMEELVANLKSAYRKRMKQLTWMSDVTKQRALAKLEAMNVKIGYPDKWKDYSDLKIVNDCYATNMINARAFSFRENMNKLGEPVDRTEWFMTPQTVNAYYSSTMNEIVFPAAILQPPFFNLNADDAVNYGAIGMVIGHEMTHGFDDQGRKSDKDGNLTDWWEPEDEEKFNELTQTIIDQYDAFEVINGMTINGKLSLGENIADYGGLTIAYHALQKSMEGKPRPEPIDGFSPEQRFFLSYANIWKQLNRDQALMRKVKEGPHSPNPYRVNGAVFNINEFYDAFEVNPSDPLYRAPEVRPTIW
ncbi:MAG: M13 family metallopeptidase [Bacteroidales bacterium]